MSPPPGLRTSIAGRVLGVGTPPENLLHRLGAGATVPEILRGLGIDPAPIFAAAGVDLATFGDPETLLPITDLARLIALSQAATGRPDFGLLIAAQSRTEKLGMLGELLATADDLRGALHSLIRYFHLNARTGVAMLQVEGDVAEFRIVLAGPYEEATVTYEDAGIGVLFHWMRAFLGDGWRPEEVLLSHRAQSGAAYRRFFRAPVRFSAARTAIVFPASDLARSSSRREEERRRLEAAANAASARLGIGWEEQVRGSIQVGLALGVPSMKDVARDLGASTRSLDRRLAERGETFAHLLREVRFATARRLLVESDTPLSEIANAVGYSGPTVFANAFRNWSGEAPRTWRRLHGRN